MLAKMWKQVLLAICVIACIFNIMSKLVNRHSLKENLESANDGITVFDIFKKDDVQVTETETIIDGVINQSTTENTVSNTTTAAEVEESTVSNTSTSAEVEENTTPAENVVVNETTEEGQVVEEQPQEKDDRTFKFSDFTIIF